MSSPALFGCEWCFVEDDASSRLIVNCSFVLESSTVVLEASFARYAVAFNS